MMKHFTTLAALTTTTALAGCESSGLSPREVPGRTQSAYLYSLYDNIGPGDAAGPARPLRLPASVAVVQVGEVAPPQPMIDALRKEAGVFARVEPLPGTESHATYAAYDSDGRLTQPKPPTVSTLRRMASDLGMEYVLLVGGTIDHESTGTPLSLLDITIVGAFAVPSRETRAEAKASGALIDVRSGRVVVNSSAEARKSSLVPAGSVEGERTKLLQALRDDVLEKLGQQVLADAKSRAALGTAGVVDGSREHRAAIQAAACSSSRSSSKT